MPSAAASRQIEYLLYRIDHLRRQDNVRDGRIVIAMARGPGVGKTEICAEIMHHSAEMGHDDLVIVPEYIYMSPLWRRWPGYYLNNPITDDSAESEFVYPGPRRTFDMERSRDEATLIAARARDLCHLQREKREVLRLPIQPVFPDEDQTFAPTVLIERHHRIVIFVGTWMLYYDWDSRSPELARIANERWFVESDEEKVEKRLRARLSLWGASDDESEDFHEYALIYVNEIEEDIERVEQQEPVGYVLRLQSM